MSRGSRKAIPVLKVLRNDIAEAAGKVREHVAKYGIAQYADARNTAAEVVLGHILDQDELFFRLCELIEEANPNLVEEYLNSCGPDEPQQPEVRQ